MLDPKVIERSADLTTGGVPDGRTENEVHEPADAPPEQRGGEQVPRSADTEAQRGERYPPTKKCAHPAGRAGDERRRC